MGKAKPLGEYPKLLEAAQIWDDKENDYLVGYRRDYSRQKTISFVDKVLFNSAGLTYTSPEYEVPAYTKFLLLINLAVTLAPTDIVIQVQFSDDRATWYQYVQGPFGDLRYEDAAGAKKECLDGPICAKYMRLYLVSAGCDAANYFLMTVKAVLNG